MCEKELVCGVLTDAYHFPSSWATTPEQERTTIVTDVVLVPGNPGLLPFYLPLLESLGRTLCSQNVCAHGFGLAHHTFSEEGDASSSVGPGLGLQAQIEHVYNCVLSIITKRSRPSRLVLIGHSIGAYINIELASRRLINERLVAAIHLMPFIRWSNIPLSHKTKLLLYKSVLQSPIEMVVNLLQTRFSRMSLNERIRLVKSGTAADGHSADVLTLLAGRVPSAKLLKHFFAMGSDEIAAVPDNEGRIQETLSALDGRVKQLVLLTDDDEWAPAQDVAIYRSKLPHTQVEYIPGLTHGFALSLANSAKVATLLTNFLAGPKSRL